MYWLGVDGVAALTIASYSTYVFNSIFYGFCEATAPILGYKYGEQNWTELACVFRNSLIIMTVFLLQPTGYRFSLPHRCWDFCTAGFACV